MEQLGPQQVITYAKRLGFTSPVQPYLSSALGSSEATLLEVTDAFSVFPNQGVRMKPYQVLKVTDRQGNLVEENRPEPTEAVRADTAFVMTNLLRGVVQRGTAARAAALNWPLAGKTGTTDDFTDAWFIGFDPDITLGVWVGYDVKRPLGPGESGAQAALPIWIDIMKVYIGDRTDKPEFAPPGNIVFLSVDKGKGSQVDPATPGAITEAFISGTQPGGAFIAANQVLPPPPRGLFPAATSWRGVAPLTGLPSSSSRTISPRFELPDAGFHLRTIADQHQRRAARHRVFLRGRQHRRQRRLVRRVVFPPAVPTTAGPATTVRASDCPRARSLRTAGRSRECGAGGRSRIPPARSAYRPRSPSAPCRTPPAIPSSCSSAHAAARAPQAGFPQLRDRGEHAVGIALVLAQIQVEARAETAAAPHRVSQLATHSTSSDLRFDAGMNWLTTVCAES